MFLRFDFWKEGMKTSFVDSLSISDTFLFVFSYVENAFVDSVCEVRSLRGFQSFFSFQREPNPWV